LLLPREASQFANYNSIEYSKIGFADFLRKSTNPDYLSETGKNSFFGDSTN